MRLVGVFGTGSSPTEHTLKLGTGAASPRATLSDVAWLAGHWAGPALGGEAEEIWSLPKAGSMMGMYRLVRDGKVVFYELLTLVQEGDTLVLRLKHFNPDLTGWEEKQKTAISASLVSEKRSSNLRACHSTARATPS